MPNTFISFPPWASTRVKDPKVGALTDRWFTFHHGPYVSSLCPVQWWKGKRRQVLTRNAGLRERLMPALIATPRLFTKPRFHSWWWVLGRGTGGLGKRPSWPVRTQRWTLQKITQRSPSHVGSSCNRLSVCSSLFLIGETEWRSWGSFLLFHEDRPRLRHH